MKSQSCWHYAQVIHIRLAANPPSCARRMTSGKIEQTKSTSAIVESRPREKRTSEFAVSFFPIALITWLVSSDPAEHAEPEDAQIPSKSSPAINAMPSDQIGRAHV